MIEDSKNPYQDIEAVSKSMDVPVEYLDFDILEIFTSYKTNPQDEFALATDMSIFDNDEFFSDANLAITQSYKVKFYDTREEVKSRLPKVTLGTNKYSTKVVAVIEEDAVVKYTTSFEKDLINAIYKKMLKAGFLLGLREKDFKKRISRLTSSLRINEKIEKKESITVAIGIEPILATNGKLLFHYKNSKDNNNKEENVRKDIDRGFLSGVVEGDVIMEYVKPVAGASGRNLKGDIIELSPPQDDQDVQITVSQNILVQENEDHIKYIALKSGYIVEENNKYDIKEEIDIESVNLKSTGSITTGLESDVKININETDYLSDAIGSGMQVETSEVRAVGNVAKDAVVKAKSVSIDGNTHAQSQIYAQTATISLHMGYLECDEAKIDRLEGGKIRAKKVYIGSVLGGDIEAEEVYIETLYSNSLIKASSIISIDALKGSNNRLIVDVNSILDKNGDVTIHHDKIKALEDELKALPKELEYKKNVIDSNKNSINMIKNRLLEMRARGDTPPAAFLNKLKDFQGLVADYNKILKQINSKEIELATLKDELVSMESIILDAKIINKDRWTELNEIKFKLLEPPIDVSYSTKENELARLITLKAGADGYVIVRSNEL